METVREKKGLIAAMVAIVSVSAVAACFASAELEQARQILNATGVKGGLIVHVGCGDGKLTAALYANDSYLVHGLDKDAENIERARKYIRSLGLYGKVSVEHWTENRLPYTDNLVNLVVSEGLGEISMDEVLRVLTPRGVAYIKEGGKLSPSRAEGWQRTIKPWSEEMDEWTHYLHSATGNAVAKDMLVGPPRHMQWVANPPYCRSHEYDSSISALVSAGGRIFYILDEGLTGITDERLPQDWSLVARDAFNGVLLWKRPIHHWGWPEWKREELEGKDWTELGGQRIRSPATLPRRLVAEGDRVYVTLGYGAPVSVLHAATGETVRTYEETERTDEILCTSGVLVLCLREPPAAGAGRPSEAAAPEFVLALEADTGEVLWRKQVARVLPLSLAAGGGRFFFHDYQAIVCLDLETGDEMWRAPSVGGEVNPWWGGSTVVVHDGVVLFLTARKLQALSAETGKTLWTGPGRTGAAPVNPPDLFVADGLVWYGGYERETDRKNIGLNTHVYKTGYDPTTGEAKRTVEVEHLISPGHHFRCYRSKATERYLLWTKRGVEFIDLKSDNHMRHNWLRGSCKYGFMPCNGLLYLPPHQCSCYREAKLNGFNALACELQARRDEPGVRVRERHERGPAYGATNGGISASGDWPTYRHDPRRSGSTTSAVTGEVRRLWQAELDGRITQPVVADGRVFVASVDSHTVYALDARNGRALWSYTAGGRVDSPPTVYEGMALFGSADGWVYCVRASDGELVWRFRGAPAQRRVGAFGQLESAWPVHGAVLVKDSVAYFAAGRSSFLDGGIYVYGLEPRTGKVLHEARVEGPYPQIPEEPGRPYDMDGAKSDVLVSQGGVIYMRHVKFDLELARLETPRITRMGDRKVGLHLFSTAGFLDDSWWNRTFWMYSERWPGFYIANQAPKSGQLLVFDESTTYGVKVFYRRNVHSPMFFPGKEGYLLFADDNNTEPVLVDETGKPEPVAWLTQSDYETGRGTRKLGATALDRLKGVGFTRTRAPKWTAWVPLRVRAMTKAGENIFIAGPPDVLDPDDPLGAFEGRKGGLLWAVSTEDGKKLAEYRLDSPPVFDGMAATNDRLYLSMKNGRVLCFSGK